MSNTVQCNIEASNTKNCIGNKLLWFQWLDEECTCWIEYSKLIVWVHIDFYH